MTEQSHVGCVLCDGTGHKDVMIGAQVARMPCNGPFLRETAADSVRHPLALDAICRHRWLILPDRLDSMIQIVRHGRGEAFEAKGQGGVEASSLIDLISVERRPAMVVRGRTAIISMTGPVFPMANLVTNICGATSLRAMQAEFIAAMGDPNIEQIVLAIDSPGGVADGIQAFAEQVYEARGSKRIVAVSQDMAASAALWIGSAAGEFVVTPSSINGSIGVVLTAYKREQGDGEIQIVSSQSPRKREDPGTESGRASLQKIVDELAQVFVETVGRNRGVDAKHVLEKFGRGGVMSGAEAVAVGMADRVGTIEQVIAGLSGNQPKRSTRAMETQEKPAITRETIAAEHPAIAEAFKKEGHEAGHKAGFEAGLSAGAEQERARIKAIHELPSAGHKALVDAAMFDGKTTAAETALQILGAEKGARTAALQTLQTERVEPVRPSAESEDQAPRADDTRPLETRCKEAWDRDPNLRADFGDNYDRYFAYEHAKANGQVRVYSPGAAR